MSRRAAVLYARISVSTEESVSVRRQILSGRKYAAARGWRVVGEFIDDGVSATRNKPEMRPGWKELLSSPMPFDAVIVWKVDRLARRVIDFLHADETLQARGAAIVCVEQSIDMTTGEGRAFAQMLAVFGEMEAATISSRITAARAQIIAEGRIPGGQQPYGWRSAHNPNGPGYVRQQDPERIEWVRGMVARLLDGQTVYSITAWLNAERAPGPRGSKPDHHWGYSSVNLLLRNPALAGMFRTDYRNGDAPTGGPRVRLNEDGQPLVANDGIITPAEFQAVLRAIDHKAHASAQVPRSRRTTSPLVANLVTCGECSFLMNRHFSRRPCMICHRCGQTAPTQPLIDFVVQRLLADRGQRRLYRKTLVVPDNPAATRKLEGIEHSLRVNAVALTADHTEADARGFVEEIARLKAMRRSVRADVAGSAVEEFAFVGTVAQAWALCVDDEQRHEVLQGQAQSIQLFRGEYKQRFRQDRVHIEWQRGHHILIPASIPLSAIHRQISAPLSAWISYRAASRLPGSNESKIRRGVRTGQIAQRKAHTMQPSLDRESVAAFLKADGAV